MKIISLNTGGGFLFDSLIAYIKGTKKDTDVYCFQEVYDTTTDNIWTHASRANLYTEMKKELHGFIGQDAFVENGYDYEGGVNFDLKYGVVMFVRNTVQIIDSGYFVVHGEEFVTKGKFEEHPRVFQWITILHNDKPLTVCNFHGVWQPNTNKKDTPERLQQSEQIISFLKKHIHPVVISGDFNLTPDTESIKILEQYVVNLNRIYNLFDIRSSVYKKEVRSGDYILASPNLKIFDFHIDSTLISDHLPLILKID